VDELNLILKEMEKQTNDLSDNDNMQLILKNNASNKSWHITFHNGTLRIETGICSISDLLMQCSPTWYLSPFSSSSTNQDGYIVQFDPGKTIRFMPLTIKLLVKCITLVLTSTPFLSPDAYDINAVIDGLIKIYFQCRNTHTPLVHESTFMEHYRGLTPPFDSLVCLSICCSVCATPCNHTVDDPHKFRKLGDFFYDLAKRKLMNQFDETHKRLENLICINLLNTFMLTVLRLEDFKNLVTMGFRICLDLTTWFEEQGNTVERRPRKE
jgi:hypothetical protein